MIVGLLKSHQYVSTHYNRNGVLGMEYGILGMEYGVLLMEYGVLGIKILNKKLTST